MSNITAIVPVKAVSGRLPNKNILPFGDSNLLIHKIRQLKKVKLLDRIVVSTDSDQMIEMAKSEGVDYVKRPTEYANESQPFGKFIDYLCDTLPGEHFMWAAVTSPLVDSAVFTKGIETYCKVLGTDYDSLTTVQRFQHYLLDDNGPHNFTMGLGHVNSEYLPVLYLHTNGINIAPKRSMKLWQYNFGPKTYKMIVDKITAADIDDRIDYETARAYYAIRKGSNAE